MLVPQYWAEARRKYRSKKGQVTFIRFGWSDTSQADAQAHAEQRAEEAMRRWLNGETRIDRREFKASYNGADGVPIREEILSRHGEAVITRNLYGARCLNTPNVLFADVDISCHPSWFISLALGVLAVLFVTGAFLAPYPIVFLVIGVILLALLTSILNSIGTWQARKDGKRAAEAVRRIRKFCAAHPEWHLRVYRTPAGLRVIALHRLFDPQDPDVKEFFENLEADKVYARMCALQNCFRARLSPKPWRIGIAAHLKPRPGVWPIKPERLPERQRWVAHYEQTARAYAACRHLEDLGSPQTHPTAQEIVRLHDDQCQALSQLPLA